MNIKRDIEDKRKYQLILTNKVEAALSVMNERINKFIFTLYQGVSHQQLTSALITLRQLEQNLKEL